MVRPPFSKRLKRTVRYLAIRGALFFTARIPLSFASVLGTLFGKLAFTVASRERARALESLGVAFPALSESERVALAQRCFVHLGKALFELGCIRQLEQDLEEWVEWRPEDRAVLDAALARKKGVVFVTGHVGNWELLARRVAQEYPSQSIAKETSDPRLTALVERFRKEGKVGSIWRGQPGAAKQMLRALKAGEILGLLIDQDTNVQSVFVPFFGKLAATPRAAADLALRTGAAVVLGFCQRTDSGRYRVRLKELPVPPASEDAPADSLALTSAMTAEIEAAIRQAPEQWVWMHRRWKSRPPAG